MVSDVMVTQNVGFGGGRWASNKVFGFQVRKIHWFPKPPRRSGALILPVLLILQMNIDKREEG